MGQAASDAYNEGYRTRSESKATTPITDPDPGVAPVETMDPSPSENLDSRKVPVSAKLPMASQDGEKPKQSWRTRPSWSKKNDSKDSQVDGGDAVSTFKRSEDALSTWERVKQEKKQRKKEEEKQKEQKAAEKAAKKAARKAAREEEIVQVVQSSP
jgi:hypothetical protein